MAAHPHSDRIDDLLDTCAAGLGRAGGRPAATAFLLPLALGLFVLVVVVRRLRRKKPGAGA